MAFHLPIISPFRVFRYVEQPLCIFQPRRPLAPTNPLTPAPSPIPEIRCGQSVSANIAGNNDFCPFMLDLRVAINTRLQWSTCSSPVQPFTLIACFQSTLCRSPLNARPGRTGPTRARDSSVSTCRTCWRRASIRSSSARSPAREKPSCSSPAPRPTTNQPRSESTTPNALARAVSSPRHRRDRPPHHQRHCRQCSARVIRTGSPASAKTLLGNTRLRKNTLGTSCQ